jgi:type IV secretion system protein VirB9
VSAASNRARLPYRIGLALLASPVLTLTLAHAEQIPERGATDPRIRTVTYDPAQVYRLQGFAGYALHLQFAPGEVFEGLGSGDMEAVSVVAQGNHLFLKPKAARVATNLTLLTNRHTYQLDYTVAPRRANATDEMIYSLTFLYPAEQVQEAASLASAHNVSEALAASPPTINRQYGFCGPPSLKPIEALDDGIQTRLRFPARVDLPAVFVRNEDGAESLVNFTVEGDALIVHRVAKAFVLRRGRLVGCIVNQAFAGGGEAPASGTRSSAVQRVNTGAVP